MAKLIKRCPTCKEIAKEISHTNLEEFQLRIINLECGHSYTETIEQSKPWQELVTIDKHKHKLLPYQGAGYEFVRASNFRALIADAPGLGKTFQGLTCLKLHPEILLPALIVVKSSLKYQVMKELIRLCGPEFQPQVIASTSEMPDVDMFQVTIVTYDLLWRFQKKQADAAEKAEKAIRSRLGLSEFEVLPEEEYENIPPVENPFQKIPFKCIILDECQQIKNPLSKRAQQVREVARDIPHVIAMSGTPIKNHAGEYFTILNILRPEIFPKYTDYLENYCDSYKKIVRGRTIYKVGGIRDMEYFKEKTKDFIIRRSREEVLPELPTLERKFVHCDFSSKTIEREYAKLQEEFEDAYYDEKDENYYQNLLAKMAKLRHKAGINKVPFVSEYVVDFINDTEPTRKLVVFTHHKDVSDILIANLKKDFEIMRTLGSEVEDPLQFTSLLSAQQRQDLVDQFRTNPKCRVLVASTQAAGEGINMQFCSDCIMMERQWNPANEEQAEGRFIRIGATCNKCGAAQDGDSEKPICKHCGNELKVSANYVISTGTIDEYFTELVEYKRSIMTQTLDGGSYNWNEEGLMKELASVLAAKGGKKWRLA